MPLVAWPHCSCPPGPERPFRHRTLPRYTALTPHREAGRSNDPILYSKARVDSHDVRPPLAGATDVALMRLSSPPNCQRTTRIGDPCGSPLPAARPQKGCRDRNFIGCGFEPVYTASLVPQVDDCHQLATFLTLAAVIDLSTLPPKKIFAVPSRVWRRRGSNP
jgi:hypothetical protein